MAVTDTHCDVHGAHAVLRMCISRLDVTPDKRVSTAAWVMGRMVSKGWKPGLSHFNAMLAVLEANPMRYVVCVCGNVKELWSVYVLDGGVVCVCK